MSNQGVAHADLPVFDRNFWDGTFRFTRIGTGSIGGKASSLVFIKDLLATQMGEFGRLPNIRIDVPTLAVIATDHFDDFISQNKLLDLPFEDMSDDRIGMAFQKTELPVELLGDLRALSQQVKTPLAIRSSSLLEDKIGRPFAGVYATKMIPNNQFDADTRFRKLVEAMKCVYASTFFREAREYIRTTGRNPLDEKMAVIIQEIVGLRHEDRFYPDVSGVARSYNYYPMGSALPEQGVVSLALGLGKTIVDGGITWTYSPEYPKVAPPFGSVDELIDGTQTHFWAVNMGKPPAYDPVSETEYMVNANLGDAESDEVLSLLASTFDVERDRMIPGTRARGPRVLNFAPLLVLEQIPLNYVIKALLRAAESVFDQKVEIEFAVTIHYERGQFQSFRVGLLQVRPIVISRESVTVSEEDLTKPDVIVASDKVLGNGSVPNIHDIVFVRPDSFSSGTTPILAAEIGAINKRLQEQGRSYLLIGFGRWGSSHPSLGIPVDWSQISAARVIIESTLPNMNVELSQGSHFFHNLSSFDAKYLMLRYDGRFRINWDWLNRQPVADETEHVRHVHLAEPLDIRVDGRSGRGLIQSGRPRSTT
ncbi:MAG TPA: PEP/pyruvate-binding domain-containing protein [Terriglobales bacterium]|nr:PEP/pyruvate-binding domain-containing protein [Terriglobales bacterium]